MTNRVNGKKLSGTVKRYSTQKGYGFIRIDNDEDGEDCFVHQSEIQSEGFRCLQEGTKVEFIFQYRNNKPTATQVSGLDGAQLPLFRSKFEACFVAQGNQIRDAVSDIKFGECQWFNKEKGFGFITCEDLPNVDIFVHISEIAGYVCLNVKEKVQFRYMRDNDGKYLAMNVQSSSSNNTYSLNTSSTNTFSSTYKPYSSNLSSPLRHGIKSGIGEGIRSSTGGFTGDSGHHLTSGPDEYFGRVKFYNQEKGFGFIYPMDGGKELYFGKSGVNVHTELEKLKEGDIVQFRIQQIPDDKRWAVDVKFADPGHDFPMPTNFGYGLHSAMSNCNFGGSISSTTKTGRMKFFNVEKGFGFIYPVDGTREIYVRSHGLLSTTDPASLKESTFVEFNIQYNYGKPSAVNVRLLHEGKPNTNGLSSKTKRNISQDSQNAYRPQPPPCPPPASPSSSSR